MGHARRDRPTVLVARAAITQRPDARNDPRQAAAYPGPEGPLPLRQSPYRSGKDLPTRPSAAHLAATRSRLPRRQTRPLAWQVWRHKRWHRITGSATARVAATGRFWLSLHDRLQSFTTHVVYCRRAASGATLIRLPACGRSEVAPLRPATLTQRKLCARTIAGAQTRKPVEERHACRLATHVASALAGSASVAAATAASTPVWAAMGPNDKFDLLVKGAEVLDPSQNLRAKRDIGIRFGVIEALESEIAPDKAQRGWLPRRKIVTPRPHRFACPLSLPYGSAIGIPPTSLSLPGNDHVELCRRRRGQQHCCAFRRAIVPQARARLFAFVHIANIGLAGFPVPELHNIDYAQTEAAAKAVAENADLVIGITVRRSENVIAKNGLSRSSERSRRANLRAPAARSCVTSAGETPELMSRILDTLRPGDVLTQRFSGAPNLAGKFTNIVQEGKLLPAPRRPSSGVLFDVWATAAASITRWPKWPRPPVPARIRFPGHPCTLRQHAGDALSDLGDEQVPRTWSVPEQVVTMAKRRRQPRSSIAYPSTAPAGGAPADLSLPRLALKAPSNSLDTRNNKRQGNGAHQTRRRSAGWRPAWATLPGPIRDTLERTLRSEERALGRGRMP